MKLIIELDLRPDIDVTALDQLLTWAQRCDAATVRPLAPGAAWTQTPPDAGNAGPEPELEQEPEGLPLPAAAAAVPNGEIPAAPAATAGRRGRGRPAKNTTTTTAAPSPAAAPPPAAVPPPVANLQPAFQPPGGVTAAMPAVPPGPASADGSMSLDELRTVMVQLNQTHPGLFFRTGKKYGWFTPEAVPPEQRSMFAQELIAASGAA